MNVLSRIVLAIYSLLWIAACAGLGVLLWNDDEMLDLEVGDLGLGAFFVTEDAGLERGVLTAILAIAGVLGLLTLLLAFRRQGASRGALRMRQQDGGVVEVTAVAIESLLKGELEQLPEVRQAGVKVSLRGGVVDTSISALIEPSASIAHVTAAVGETVATVLKDQVGVTAVRRPTVHVRYDEVQARPVGARSRPAAPPHAAPPASRGDEPADE